MRDAFYHRGNAAAISSVFESHMPPPARAGPQFLGLVHFRVTFPIVVVAVIVMVIVIETVNWGN